MLLFQKKTEGLSIALTSLSIELDTFQPFYVQVGGFTVMTWGF